MKRILLLLFMLAGLLAQGQDWQGICSPGTTFYKWIQNEWTDIFLFSFRTDTVHPIGNSDTLFISYTTIRDSSIYYTCKDTTGGDALGRKVIRQHDGWYFFFNCKNDTIRINSLAVLNETWRYCPLPANSYIEAKVTEIITDSVLGTTDQVKVITLQAKTSSGTNTSHIFNQKKIKLSQHYGLSEIYDFNMTPVDTLHYYLAGIPKPSIGIQDFTLRDVFDLDVGDEFHYSGFHTFNGGATVTWKSIRKILEKVIHGNDSVTYKVRFCKLLTFPVPPPNTQTSSDTLYERYSFSETQGQPPILGMPDQFFRIDMSGMTTAPKYQRTISPFNGRPVQCYFYWGYTFYPDLGCYEYPFEAGGDNVRYSPGLGQTGYSAFTVDYGMTWEEEDLVYFKKGSEVWGTPVATDCATLVPVEPVARPGEMEVCVSPNPVEISALVTLENPSGKEYRFSLYDMYGRCLMRSELFSSSWKFSREGISPGIYFYSVTDNSGFISRSGKLVFR
jgi:hypothetical protein